METKFKSLKITISRSGEIEAERDGKTVTFYKTSRGYNVGGVCIGNMPKTPSDFEGVSTFYAEVAEFFETLKAKI